MYMKKNNFLKMLIIGLLMVMSMSSSAGELHAQTKDSLKTDALSQIRADRKIRPGDILDVVVYGHDELPKQIKVEADGTIKYPFMKDIKVDGMSVEQLTNILSARLSQYIGGRAEVIVAYAKDEMIEVIVLGSVAQPGSHKIPRNHTIQGAIATAGGATVRSDLDRTKLIRINPETSLREEIEVPMVSIIVETGDIRKLPALRDGDVIFVPSIYGAVYANVLGAVGKPGNYELFPGANLVDVIFLAGGPKDDASIRTVKLIRRIGVAQTEEIVDVEAVLKAKGGSVPLVQPGDIVFVPAKKFTLKTIFQVLSYAATILTLIFLSKQTGLL